MQPIPRIVNQLRQAVGAENVLSAHSEMLVYECDGFTIEKNSPDVVVFPRNTEDVARIVKICHNVFLGVVTQSLAEITVLAEKAGVPRRAFLEFMNRSVMGSMFTRYKTPALVNLDFKPTFTPPLLRKDLDLGLDAGKRYGVPLPLAEVTRDLVDALVERGVTEEDFATLLVEQAEKSGLALKPENVPVGDGLSPDKGEQQ